MKIKEAKDVCTIAQIAMEEMIKREQENVSIKIMNAANLGLFKVIIDADIFPENMQLLLDKGFSVKKYPKKDYHGVTIKVVTEVQWGSRNNPLKENGGTSA